MRVNWINNNSNTKCILFFNGWGMDENAVQHLKCDDFDICEFSGYHKKEGSFPDLNSYSEVYVIAWSLGVWMATSLLSKEKIKINRCIAINGTELPIDDSQGIPEKIFTGTLNGWNERNKVRFNRRISGNTRQINNSNIVLNNRSANDQKEELQYIKDQFNESNKPSINWDCAIIGSNDLIFAPANQQSFWKGKTSFTIIESAHYPFVDFTSWKQIIEL